ncbi:MAG TPA: glucose-6-phosphate isomerase [Burkholderiaceae bacterium]|nr:glucose-6-phosphate isomerase [Burkholderiaceae bacterium]
MKFEDRPRCDRTPVWASLHAHYQLSAKDFDVREAFAHDRARFENFSQQAPHVFADLSKNRLDATTQNLLINLAQQCGVEAHRDAMFAGMAINQTENRAVMHWLLRSPSVLQKNIENQAVAGINTAYTAINNIANTDASVVQQMLSAMLAYAERIRADVQFTDIVNIGIGGSDIGPQMVTQALEAFATTGQRMHFVSNVDGAELAGVLKQLKAENTLFIVSSKSFTTVDTLTNAQSAKTWFAENYSNKTDLGVAGKGISRHFVALTSNVKAAQDFGIHTTFGFWDWVGGRYSLWSAIGLPIAIAIGEKNFSALLLGAADMDTHFCTAPLAQNLPVRLGLLDVWYRNFHGYSSRCVAPYHSALKRLPAYLQQLDMESNGKRVDAKGDVLPYATAGLVWGEPGTDGQHTFFQVLHQGSDVVPVEFVVVKRERHGLSGHQQILLANALAQSQALMLGKTDPNGHKNFPGNRPSTTLILDDLTPTSLGALIALYEHRTFVAGSVWGINSFDQWGVELGKVLATDIEQRFQTNDVSGLDASTQGLLRKLMD